jgi:hypothetical protein
MVIRCFGALLTGGGAKLASFDSMLDRAGIYGGKVGGGE